VEQVGFFDLRKGVFIIDNNLVVFGIFLLHSRPLKLTY